MALVSALPPAAPARAQDATWLANPGSGNFYNANNWAGGSVPTGTATFGASNTTALTLGLSGSFGGWTFDAGASHYTFDVTASLAFTGTGITINSGSASITNNDALVFVGSSTAGSAAITNQSLLTFYNTSTAGNAAITNYSLLRFSDASTASNAAITNNWGLDFRDASTAGSAAITNNNVLQFLHASTAGSATITNNNVLQFLNTSTDSSATITNNNVLQFYNTSTAGDATITNSGFLGFYNTSTAGNAALINNAGATVDFSISAGLSGDGRLSAGSIAGAGRYILGANELTVGSNNLTTEVSGTIYGTGSLVKTGTGTLTLSGTNTYTGGTAINGGILQLGDAGGIGSILGTVTVGSGGTFDVVNADTSGITTVSNAGRTYFGNGTSAGSTTIANNGDLEFVDTSTAGNATITNSGSLVFWNGSTAGSATITNNAFLNFYQVSTAGSSAIINDSALRFFDSSTAGSATIANNNTLYFYNTSTAGSAAITNNSGLYFSDTSTAGSATITNNVYLAFSGTGTAGSANITNTGTLLFYDTSTAGSATITNNSSAQLNFYNTSTAGAATITNHNSLNFWNTSTAGNATISNDHGLMFFDASTAGSATFTNNAGGEIIFMNTSTAGSASITNNGTAVSFFDTSTAGSAAIVNNSRLLFTDSTTAGTATITNSGTLGFVINGTGGNASILNTAGGRVDFSHSTGLADDGKLSVGSIAGAGDVNLGARELTIGGNNLSTTVSGVISDCGASGTACYANTFGLSTTGGSLVKTGTGTLTLSGTNAYTGATIVNGGTLAVNGSTTSSSGITVDNGATLGGTGVVPTTTVYTGGALAPGNSIGTLTVNGNLTFNAGSFYTVEVSPTAADRTDVTGIATLTGATVQAVALPGSFRAQTYTILTAAGGFAGTEFDGLTGSSFAPGARNPHLTYDLNNVYLVLDPGTIQLPAGASGNQTSVADGINQAVESGATPPAAFDALLNISGAQLAHAVDQVSGQAATGGALSGMQMTTAFLSLMLNPNPDGGAGALVGARNFASEPAISPEAAAAYAAVTPKDRIATAFAEPHWSVWGQVYGGTNRTGGDAALGTADTTARIRGLATGFDYRAAPDLTFGFALAGGSTSWGLSQSLGGGKSEVLQLGAYGRKEFGAAYLSAALSYGWHDMSTDRTVTMSGIDKLAASFDAHSFGGRVETGYRVATPWTLLTPYAALQVQSFRTSSYRESAVSGSSTFALAYDARSTTATRTELGAWLDDVIALDQGNVIVLRSRAAWAHNHSSNPAMSAVFQTLPGSNFTVDGAQAAPNALLTSIGAELRLANNWSVAARFDGEFASRAQTYAGTGTLRYAW